MAGSTRPGQFRTDRHLLLWGSLSHSIDWAGGQSWRIAAAGLPRRQSFWGVRSWVGALERRSRTEWVCPNKAIGETPKSVSFGLITAI